MRDPKTIPVGRVEIDFPDGSRHVAEWTMDEIGEAPAFIRPGSGPQMPPDWLENPRRRWDHPQDPITFSGRVKPGREVAARTALGIDAA